jgi:hypothetical protein
MDARRDSTDGPEDVDATFAEIVASLERDGVGADWPDQSAFPEVPDDDLVETEMRPEGQPRVAAVEPDAVDDDPDDHFVPPDPPPLPALRPGTIAALLLMVVGVVLLVVPGLFGLDSRLGTPLALVTLCAGIGWLLLRMRQGPPPDSGWDDGAQI